jgi:mannose/fructose/N-acetylgalactosamine-specific phosphotransferase system component IIB
MENTQPPVPPQAPAAPTAPQPYDTQAQQPQRTIEVVGRVNFPSTQLFEATGFIDTSKQFPTANAFMMFVPGIPDQSKMSGRTYDQSHKETMKINVRDLFGLAEALNYAATYGQCDFVIFTDSSKFAGTAQGQGQTKQISVGTAVGNNGKPKIFLNYKGANKITIALEKWHAVGLAEQLKTLASATLTQKFEKERLSVQ